MKLLLKTISYGLLFIPLGGYGQTVSTAPKQITVVPETGTANVQVNSDTYWGIYDYAEWVTPDTTWYYGNKTLAVHTEENPFMVPRTDTVTVYCTNAQYQYFSDAQFSIIQAANSWGIAESSFQIGSQQGDMASLLITTDNEWQIVACAPWIAADVSQWKGTTEIVFTATEANNQTAVRQGTVTVVLHRNDGTCITGTVSVLQDPGTQGPSQGTVSFTAEQGSMQTVPVTTDEQWDITALPQWLIASPQSGTGTATIAFIAMANSAPAQRNGLVEITTAGGDVYEIAVIQSGVDPQFTITPSGTQFGEAANSSVAVTISSNTYWGLTQFPDWFTNTDIFTYADSSFSLSVEQNPFTVSRTADVFAYYMDAQGNYINGETVTFTQAAASAGISDTVLSVNSTHGSTVQFSVNTSSRWQINALSDWLQVSPSSSANASTITVTASENPFTSQREGYIDVRMQLGQSNWITGTVKVYQQGSSSGVSTDILSVAAAQSVNQLQITANTGWTVSGMNEWVQVSPLSGSGSATLEITISENKALYSQADTLTVSFNNGTTVPVVIIQEPGNARCTFSPASLIFDAAEGSTLFVSVESNTSWGFINLPDWITTAEINGWADDSFQLHATENTSGLSRTDSITMYWLDYYNGYHAKTIAITQEPNSSAVLQKASFQEGWNLFSINYQMPTTALDYIIDLFGANLVEIKDLDAYYRSTQPSYLNRLTAFEPGNGYLIYLQNAQILYQTGMPLSVTEAEFLNSVESGWNLIGVPFPEAKTATDIFNRDNCKIIKGFDAFYDFQTNTGNLLQLEPGKAYMIKK